MDMASAIAFTLDSIGIVETRLASVEREIEFAVLAREADRLPERVVRHDLGARPFLLAAAEVHRKTAPRIARGAFEKLVRRVGGDETELLDEARRPVAVVEDDFENAIREAQFVLVRLEAQVRADARRFRCGIAPVKEKGAVLENAERRLECKRNLRPLPRLADDGNFRLPRSYKPHFLRIHLLAQIDDDINNRALVRRVGRGRYEERSAARPRLVPPRARRHRRKIEPVRRRRNRNFDVWPCVSHARRKSKRRARKKKCSHCHRVNSL